MIEELTNRINGEFQKINVPVFLPELYEPIRYTYDGGGKRIRPILLMLSSRIFGVKDDDSVHAALAVEIFHNFTLVHDDIMDNAPLRRGRPSVFQKWNQNTAILSGDVMFSLAIQQILKTKPDWLKPALETFLDVTIKVCEGQQMDLNFENKTIVTLSEYLRMIELKTACLLAGSLKIGAILGNAGNSIENKMFELGLKLGSAFQLIDDYLDVFGDTETVGKLSGGDIISGKKTFLHIHTLNALSGNQKEEYFTAFNSLDLDPSEKIEIVKTCYEVSGAKEEIVKLAEDKLSYAENILKSLSGNKRAIDELIFLTKQLSKREK